MKLTRITIAVLAAALALVASACGGAAGGVPDGVVAVVDGTEIPRADLEELIDWAKRGFEAQKQEFPKAGTPEYQSIQTQYVTFLVQRVEFEQAAKDLGVEIAEGDVDKATDEFVKSRFGGDREKLEKDLKEQGLSFETFQDVTIRSSVLSQKLFDAVTKDVAVSEQDILAYYTQNQAQYGTPESRDVRHILIAEKDKDGQVDVAKSKIEANRIYTELQGGADFAALAKEFSEDPGSKDSGGKLTIKRGETVPEFDKTAFELKQGEISRPVKTTYGYHVIEALSAVRKATTTPIAKVRESIRASLLQQKRTDVMRAWVEDIGKKYEGKVTYAAGFEPPELPTTPTETK
jgi:parvulin-like peptidyl-prolyl isomerase